MDVEEIYVVVCKYFINMFVTVEGRHAYEQMISIVLLFFSIIS